MRNCTRCGAEVGADSRFCDKCGNQLDRPNEQMYQPASETDNDNAQQPDLQQTKTKDQLRGVPAHILHSPDENVLAVLGKGYLSSILKSGDITKSAMVLTDRRLYYFGKTYGKVTQIGGINPVTSEGEIDIVNISSAAFINIRANWKKLVPAIIFLTIGILLLMVGLKERNGGFEVFLGLGFGFFGGVLLHKAQKEKQKWFSVDYAGGTVAVPVSWYSEDEMRSFRKAVFDTKDKLL